MTVDESCSSSSFGKPSESTTDASTVGSDLKNAGSDGDIGGALAGRRIVDPVLLARRLDDGCVACQRPLRLSVCGGETR